MRILFLLLGTFCFICATTEGTAQDSASSQYEEIKKWKVTELNIGLGVGWDTYQSMSLEQLMMFAKNPNQLQRDLSFLTEEVNTSTGGAGFYTSFSLSPYSYKKKRYRNNQELQLGMALYSPKEAMVTYKNEEMDTSIVFCNLHAEAAIEGAYVRKGNWGNRIHWHIGTGISTGLTFANEMVVISGKYFKPEEHPSTQESSEVNRVQYKAKPVLYTRVYIPFGIHYAIGAKSLLGLSFRTGLGAQMIEGEKARFIKNTGAVILSAKFQLN